MEKTKYRVAIVVAIISAVSTILVGLFVYFWPTSDTVTKISSEKDEIAMELVNLILSEDNLEKKLGLAKLKVLYMDNPERAKRILSIINEGVVQEKLFGKERRPKLKFLLLTDETITITGKLIDYLNGWCKIFEFKMGRGKFK